MKKCKTYINTNSYITFFLRKDCSNIVQWKWCSRLRAGFNLREILVLSLASLTEDDNRTINFSENTNFLFYCNHKFYILKNALRSYNPTNYRSVEEYKD